MIPFIFPQPKPSYGLLLLKAVFTFFTSSDLLGQENVSARESDVAQNE
jgi:hypothetical protein